MSEVSFKPIGLDREKLRLLIQERGLDGVILSSPENVFYTTGYPALPGAGNPILYALRNQDPFFAYAGPDGQIALLCWGPAAMGIEYGTEDVRMSFMRSMLMDDLGALVEEKFKPGCAVGVETTFPFEAYQVLQDRVRPTRLDIIDDLFYRLRRVKSQAEIGCIRKSTHIIDQTVLELAQNLRLGMTRLELIREAKQRMIRNEADGVDHVTVAFGPANPEFALD